MVWFLALHIVALVFWCGALLYLPILLGAVRETDAVEAQAAVDSGIETELETPREYTLERFVFTHVATPAALIAIFAGTAVFLIDRNAAPWLIVKLLLVSGLVLGHALTGFLLLRLENAPEKPARLARWALGVVLAVLMTAIIAIVLAKPDLRLELEREVLPWVD